MEKKVYEIKFNHSGVVYIFAGDFSEAQEVFLKSKGDDASSYEIRSIVLLGKGLTPSLN